MDWHGLLSPRRFRGATEELVHTQKGNERAEDGRSPFQVDFDRIIFSSWFRRLQGKTQVHPMPANDHVHSRLTHTLEVGSVGRSLGELVGLELARGQRLPSGVTASDMGAIVQAAAMAHDIGNPPFGHAGEFAIRDWFSQPTNQARFLARLTPAQAADLKGFEGNAQGFRVITQLENNYHRGGLRLTHACLGALIKYPWPADHPRAESGKFGFFQAEAAIFDRLADALCLPVLPDGSRARHPLVELVEVADDACYALVDLEDGVELGLISLEDFVTCITPLIPGFQGIDRTESPRRLVSYLRTRAIGTVVREAGRLFLTHEAALLAGTLSGGLLSHGQGQIDGALRAAKSLAAQRIFEDRRKRQLEIGAFATIGVLLNHFCDALFEAITAHGAAGQTSFKTRRVLALLGRHNGLEPAEGAYPGLIKICDYVAGMTDHYASFMAQQLNGGFE